MRLHIISTVFRKELREMLRDRRSLAIMFGIPLLLYPLLTLTIAGLGMSKEKQYTEQRAKIAVLNPNGAPHFAEMLSRPDSGVEIIAATDPQLDLAAKRLDAVVVIPPNAELNALQLRDSEIKIQLDRSRTEANFTEKKLNKILDDYEKWIIEQRLAAHHVGAEVLKPLQHSIEDIASGSQRFGKFLAMMLPVLLLITGMLGALFPALNATTTERELGTMETLLVSPAGRMELLVAKGAIVLLSGLLTSALNMASMSLVLWRSLSMIGKDLGVLTINPSALFLSFLAAVPTLITFSTIVLMVGLIARNFREANSLATPIMMIPMAAMVIGIAEPKISLGLLVTPVANTTIIIREVLVGSISAGAFVLAFVSSCVYAGLMLSLAARVFSSEQLVNPAWEPVSLKGLRSGAPRRPRFPAVDEAFALFALTLLLSFYITPSLPRDLVKLVIVTEVALIAAPAILFAVIGRYRWKEVFSLRWPGMLALVAGGLIGFGMVPWVEFFAQIQNRFWEPGPTQRALEELIFSALRAHPITIPILVGVLAGVCEELLYRGPIQAGLMRRMPKWVALVIGGLLFSAAHLDVHGMPLRMLIGIVLGWMVVYTGSIFPAMIAHAVYDAAALGFVSYAVMHTKAADLTATPEAVVEQWDPKKLAFGAAALILGAVLLRLSSKRAPVHVVPETIIDVR